MGQHGYPAQSSRSGNSGLGAFGFSGPCLTAPGHSQPVAAGRALPAFFPLFVGFPLTAKDPASPARLDVESLIASQQKTKFATLRLVKESQGARL